MPPLLYKIGVTTFISLIVLFGSFAQQVDFTPYYYSDYKPSELNKDAASQFEEIYARYVQQYGLGDEINEREFVHEFNFSLEELNRGGHIFYGDPISKYLNELKDWIIEDPQWRARIKVYVADFPVINAFTNDFGNIYVNLASIAKLDSEGELIYLLAHEIAHVKMRHSHKQAVYNSKSAEESWSISDDNREFHYHAFSRSQESEADSLAYLMVHDRVSPLEMKRLLHCLETAGDPVISGAIDLTILTAGNQQMYDRLLPVWQSIDLEDVYYGLKEEDDSLSTHPSIDKRISDLEEWLNAADSSIHYQEGERFQEMKQAANYLLVNTFLQAGMPLQALDLILKLRAMYPEDPFLIQSQQNGLALLITWKYGIEQEDAIINAWGNSVQDRDFLKWRYFALLLNSYDIHALAYMATVDLNKQLETDGLLAPSRYETRMFYKKMPFLFNSTDSAALFASWSDETDRLIRNSMPLDSADFEDLMEMEEEGPCFVFMSDTSVLMRYFLEAYPKDANFESLIREEMKLEASTDLFSEGIFEILMHPASASYRFGRGRFNKSTTFNPDMTVAAVGIESYYFQSRSKRDFRLNYDKNIELKQHMQVVMERQPSFQVDYSNAGSENTVKSNHLHHLAMVWLNGHALDEGISFSAADDQVKKEFLDKGIRYISVILCVVNRNKGAGKSHYLNYYEMYFDLTNGDLVYLSKMGSRTRSFRPSTEQFAFLSNYNKKKD